MSATPSLLPSVLPPNATLLERNMESAGWRLRNEGPTGIRALWNPRTIPAALLPWLAWGLGVDAWDTTWDDGKKRAEVASALADHQVDGTLAGVRRVTGLYGGTVTNVVRPPCQLYYGAAQTQAQKDAALAVYPQLILRTDGNPFAVPAGATFSRLSYMGNCYGVDLGSAERALPKAFIQDQGSTIQCGVSQLTADGTAYLQIQVPISNPHGTYAGGFPKFGPAVDAPVYLLRLMQSYAGPGLGVNYKLVDDGVDPTQVFPDWISETYSPPCIFAGGHFGTGGLYWQASDASDHVYARLYLFNESRTLEASGKSFFVDAVHTGVQPHTAQIRAWFPLQRSPWAPSYYGHGFSVAEDYEWLTRYCDSLARCTSLRDTILVDTANYAVVACGQTLSDPATMCGAMLPRE
jgi:phage tail P2-like protein